MVKYIGIFYDVILFIIITFKILIKDVLNIYSKFKKIKEQEIINNKSILDLGFVDQVNYI
jgi:hypothetical protein